MSLINVHNIEKIYISGDVETPVLRGINFSIEKGEFVAIMGPSGSGKSTLLHILGFLDRHSAGEYRFDGKTIDDYSPVELARVRNRKMGFVFQTFNLLPRTSVLENVKLPLTYSVKKESEWDNLARARISDVGLEHRIGHDPAQLSGGERQRVAIARALVLDPEVIFADEPTGNLDSVSGETVMHILKDLNRSKGKTVIVITHDDEVARYADRVIFIRDGLVEKDYRTHKDLL